MATARPRVLEFDVSVDRDRTAHSVLGGGSIPADDGWWAEHLVLAALVRCTLTSLDYHAQRTGLIATASGSAHGTVTKRDTDGRYGFVDVEARYDVEIEDPPEREVVTELLESAERGCFVGNSLTAAPRYHWTVNGEELR